MLFDEKKRQEREEKLRALELRIRMQKYIKLKQDLKNVKRYLIADIELMEQSGSELPEELKNIKEELQKD